MFIVMVKSRIAILDILEKRRDIYIIAYLVILTFAYQVVVVKIYFCTLVLRGGTSCL